MGIAGSMVDVNFLQDYNSPEAQKSAEVKEQE